MYFLLVCIEVHKNNGLNVLGTLPVKGNGWGEGIAQFPSKVVLKDFYYFIFLLVLYNHYYGDCKMNYFLTHVTTDF